MLNTTIVALATPFMESAIAVIRLSGKDAIKIINQLFTKDLSNVKSQTIHYGYLKFNNEIIDEVMVSVYKAPHTYTCEDMIEISTHGSLIIINKVISACVSLGAVIAERGEFTKRAYLNGRIDLIQAESINDIIHGDSEEAINIAISGLKGVARATIVVLSISIISLFIYNNKIKDGIFPSFLIFIRYYNVSFISYAFALCRNIFKSC